MLYYLKNVKIHKKMCRRKYAKNINIDLGDSFFYFQIL